MDLSHQSLRKDGSQLPLVLYHMTTKMSNREEGDSNKPKINGLSSHNAEAGNDLELDDTLTALLASTLLSPDIENLNDISQIAGEYSSLNNTIDELNRYLDRWDERHEQLRTHIREALLANEEDNVEEIEDQEESSTCGVNEGTGSSEDIGNCETKEKQSYDENDKCL